jgi:cytochrome P450
MSTIEAPRVSLGLADPDVVQDPVAKLTEIRETAPVLYDPDIDRYAIGRYDLVRSVVLKADDFVADLGFFDRLFAGRHLLSMDDPDHAQVRGFFNPSFSRAGAEKLRPAVKALSERLVDDALERLRAGESPEWIEDVARPLAVGTLAMMLGVPDEDGARFLEWACRQELAVQALLEPSTTRREEMEREGMAATAELAVYSGEKIAQRRAADPAEDLISILAHSPELGELLDDTDERSMVTGFVFGGHDTSVRQLGHLLITLAQHPDQRRAIALDRGLIPQAIEELMRWAVSTPIGPKQARRDVTVDGITIPAGAEVLNVMAAANRDPRRWPDDPDRFDIFREQKTHIAFGFGPHSCIGQNIAKLELAALIEAVLDRMPDYELADQDIRYGPAFVIRGPLALHLAI